MVRQYLDSLDMNMSKLQELAKGREAWHAAVHGVTKSWTRLGDFTLPNQLTLKRRYSG